MNPTSNLRRRAAALGLALSLLLSSTGAHAAPGQRSILAASGQAGGDYFGFSVHSAGDFNGDGVPDMIVGAPQSDSHRGHAYVYYGGPGTDDVPDIDLPGQAPGDLFGAAVLGGFDFNADGFDDIAVSATLNDAGGSDAGRVYVFFGGPGADALADRTINGLALESLGHSITTGDMNGDTIDDLIVGTVLGSGRVLLYLGGPAGDVIPDATFRARGESGDFGYTVVSGGDVNHDKFDDLLIGSPYRDFSLGRVELFFGGLVPDTTADLTLGGTLSNGTFGMGLGWIGDVNGDLFGDFAVGAPNAGNSGVAYVYYGGAPPNGTFDVGLSGSGTQSHFGFAISGLGDLTGDGVSDFAVGDYGWQSGASQYGRVYLYYGGVGLHSVADRTLLGESPQDQFGFSIANLGDFDMDGGDEVVIGAWQPNVGAGRVYVYDLNPDTLRYVRAFGSLDAPTALCAGDFDEDGVLDLAIAAGATGSVRIFRGLSLDGVGLGTFAATGNYPFASGAGEDVATGDFNEDGIVDLVGISLDGYTIFDGNGAGGVGDGTFTARPPFPVSNARGVAVSDFNDDGILDLAVCASLNTGNVRIHLGNGTAGHGDGTFTQGVLLSAGLKPSYLLAHDFNEDGITDLAVTSQTDGAVSIFLGQGSGGVGNGTFGAPAAFAAGTGALNLATGDFNEDGITDLAVAGGSGLAVLLGQGAGGIGNGQFGAPVIHAPGIATRAVVAVDVTGDDRTDLVATCGASNRVELLTGNGASGVGTGTFTLALTRPALKFPSAIVAGDFNQNRRADYVVAAITSDSLGLITSDDINAGERVLGVVPGGGEILGTNVTSPVSWAADPAVRSVAIDLSRDGGVTWSNFVPVAYESPYRWEVPFLSSDSLRVRVRDASVPNRVGGSESNFAVHPPVGIPDGGTTGPARVALASGNPATGLARFVLELPRAQRVSVDLYDVSGRRVATIARGPLPAGPTALSLDTTRLVPGVLFVRAQGEDFATGTRIVVVR